MSRGLNRARQVRRCLPHPPTFLTFLAFRRSYPARFPHDSAFSLSSFFFFSPSLSLYPLFLCASSTDTPTSFCSRPTESHSFNLPFSSPSPPSCSSFPR